MKYFMIRGGARESSFWLFLSVLLGLVWFGISRWWLQIELTPAFDPDSYKYLSVAYAFWQQQPLPSIVTDPTHIDGILHFVPGYSALVALIWGIAGQASLFALMIIQSGLALLGYSVLAVYVARYLGPWVGIIVWWVLITAPALAWLEHTVMPDAWVMPLLFLGVGLCSQWPPQAITRPLLWSAIAAGFVIGLMVAMRTSSQALWPVLPLLAFSLRRGIKPWLAWLLGFLCGGVLALAPVLLFNFTHYHYWGLSASTGRNVYLSAAWSNLVDNTAYLKTHGFENIKPIMQPYIITEHAYREALKQAPTVAQADQRLLAQALAVYHEQPLAVILQARWEILRSLFDPAADTRQRLEPLGPMVDYYLANLWASPEGQQWATQRFKTSLAPEIWQTLRAEYPDEHLNASAKSWVKAWITIGLWDGVRLLAAYLLAAWGLLTYLSGTVRLWVAVVMILPPLLFIAVYAIVGAPLYRYQVVLHPCLLATVATAMLFFFKKFISDRRLTL